MLRPGLQPTLEERSVIDRQVHGEADGRRGKDPQEQPALPVVERAGRPEDEDDKEEGPQHSFNDRLPVERIHIKHQAGRLSQQSGAHVQNGELLQRSGSHYTTCLSQSNVWAPTGAGLVH